MGRWRGSAALVLALAGGGCAEREAACTDGEVCGPGRVCAGAQCLCVDDQACDDGEGCNRFGRCQTPSACRSNQDCEAGSRCDIATGRCQTAVGCTRDIDCPLESICEAGSCQSGCRGDGDCHPFRICLASGCVAGCRSTRDCPLGEACVGNRCFARTQPGLCKPCGGAGDCDARTDWCLVNRAYDPRDPSTGSAMECAPDCDGAPELCPSGSECRPVVVRYRSCTADADCGAGRRCVVEEGEPIGRCTCWRDADCVDRLPPTCGRFGLCEYPPGKLCGDASDCEAAPACGPHGPGGASRCFLDRDRPCASGADCQCVEGACVLTGQACADDAACLARCEGGGCVVGAGCVPEEGLTCPDLRR